MVEEHFKMKSFTPKRWHLCSKDRVEEHFKMKSFTPKFKMLMNVKKVEEHFKMKSFTPYLVLRKRGFRWKNISK